MKIILMILTFLNIIYFSSYGQEMENVFSVNWRIDNNSSIAGFKTNVLGNPEVVYTKEHDNVVRFNGINDGLIVESNPLKGAENFTIEIIFKPDTSYPGNIEQRFLHIQDSSNSSRRVLIELRMTENHKWYLDTFIKAETEELTLVSPNKLHSAGDWSHAALVYSNGVMTHYVNGEKEISGGINYLPISNAFTSIGTRMDKRSWFKGAVALVKITHEALTPSEFYKFYKIN